LADESDVDDEDDEDEAPGGKLEVSEGLGAAAAVAAAPKLPLLDIVSKNVSYCSINRTSREVAIGDSSI